MRRTLHEIQDGRQHHAARRLQGAVSACRGGRRCRTERRSDARTAERTDRMAAQQDVRTCVRRIQADTHVRPSLRLLWSAVTEVQQRRTKGDGHAAHAAQRRGDAGPAVDDRTPADAAAHQAACGYRADVLYAGRHRCDKTGAF